MPLASCEHRNDLYPGLCPDCDDLDPEQPHGDTVDQPPMDCAATNTRRLLDAGGFQLENLSDMDRDCLALLSFHNPTTVAAVCRLLTAACNAEARRCPSLGGVT